MKTPRRLLPAAAALTLCAAAPASAAAPPGGGLRTLTNYTCDTGQAVIVASQGDSAWIDGVHYVVYTYVSSGYQQGQKVGLAANQLTCTSQDGKRINIGVRVPPN